MRRIEEEGEHRYNYEVYNEYCENIQIIHIEPFTKCYSDCSTVNRIDKVEDDEYNLVGDKIKRTDILTKH